MSGPAALGEVVPRPARDAKGADCGPWTCGVGEALAGGADGGARVGVGASRAVAALGAIEERACLAGQGGRGGGCGDRGRTA